MKTKRLLRSSGQGVLKKQLSADDARASPKLRMLAAVGTDTLSDPVSASLDGKSRHGLQMFSAMGMAQFSLDWTMPP